MHRVGRSATLCAALSCGVAADALAQAARDHAEITRSFTTPDRIESSPSALAGSGFGSLRREPVTAWGTAGSPRFSPDLSFAQRTLAATPGDRFHLPASVSRSGPGFDPSLAFRVDRVVRQDEASPESPESFESFEDPGAEDLIDTDTSLAFSADGPSAEAQANNPLASIIALNLQNYYIGELTESDKDANQFVVRYAQPFSIGDSDWLLRASLPLNSFPTPPDGDTETALGDLNVFAAYLFDTGNPAVSFGFGPQATFPTASDDDLGSEKYSLGFANVLFDARSEKFQWGYLLTWQQSIAGEDDRDDVNFLAFQPFTFYQLGDGWYLRAAPIMAFNLHNGDYSVPLGVGLGKVIKTKSAVINLFVEPQFSVADQGPGQPEWQIYMGINMQFPF